MTKLRDGKPSAWKKITDRILSLSQYMTGEEFNAEDNNDAIFRAAFPDLNNPGDEKRVLGRHRICIPAVLRYGIAETAEQTEVTNLNERGLFVYCSTEVARGSSIQVEITLPPELNLYGRRRVRYMATVVRVEPQPSGQRFGVAAAIKNCEDLPLLNAETVATKS